MNVYCRFPFQLSGKDLLSEALTAIAQNVPLTDLPENAKYPIPVYVPMQARIQLEASANGLPLREVIERAAYGLRRARLKATVPAQVSTSETTRLRSLLLENLAAGINSGHIVLAEASTGLGKSRILGQTAKHILESKPKATVWVAAPTLSIMLHLLREFSRVGLTANPAALIGRQQFVSIHRAEAILGEIQQTDKNSSTSDKSDLPDRIAAARAWLHSGGAPVCEHTRAFADYIPGLSFLCDDLAELMPEIPPSDCCLITSNNTEDEPASAVIEAMRERAENSRLVICTHAMLMLRSIRTAADQALPFTHILIDEAHELEQVTARLCSSDLSLLGFRSWLRQQKFSKASDMIDTITQLFERLRDETSLKNGDRISPEQLTHIRKQLETIPAVLRAAKKGEKDERELYASAIDRLLHAKDDWTGISFSPVKRFPAIFCGPNSVFKTLQGLWDRVQGAGLVSATIFLPDFYSVGISSAYMLNKLAIPLARQHPLGPMTASWVMGTPTMYLPDTSSILALSLPSRISSELEVEEAEDSDTEADTALHAYGAWLDSVAKAILLTAHDAKGGTLVLCTSFRDVRGLRDRLTLALGDRLLVHDKGLTVTAQQQKFMTIYRTGIRPVWLATGAAWTGLDLSDPTSRAANTPDTDFLLTDLCITRTPFGLNRSSTQWGRKRHSGFYPELAEAAIMLRQGIGRLIRQEGVTERRIWFLDGRIYNPARRNLARMGLIIDGYIKRKTFSIGQSSPPLSSLERC